MTTKEIFDLILSIAGLVVAILSLVLGVSITNRLKGNSRLSVKNSTFTNSPINTSKSGNAISAAQGGQAINGDGNLTNCTISLSTLSDAQIQSVVTCASDRCFSNVTSIIKIATIKVREGEWHNVTEEWFDHFCSDAKGASDQEVRNLWAELLAGEIKRPGRFSFKAMDILASMSSQDAKDFFAIMPYLFDDEILFNGGLLDRTYKFEFFLNLFEMGLLNVPGWVKKTHILKPHESATLTNGDYNVIITNQTDYDKESNLLCYTLTRAAKEIASLSSSHGNLGIVEDAVECIKRADTINAFSVEYKKIVNVGSPK